MATEKPVSWSAVATVILLPLVFAMAPYALKGYVGATPGPTPPPAVASPEDLKALERRVSVTEAAVTEQVSTNKEIKAEQERQGRLIEGIARRVGILVAR